MQIKLRKRLGDLLVEEGIISEHQVEEALSHQKNTGRKLGDTLIQLGFLTETQMLTFLSQQLNVPLIDLSRVQCGCGCRSNSAGSTRSSITRFGSWTSGRHIAGSDE